MPLLQNLARIDALCGGAPPYRKYCPFCPRTVGPYYNLHYAKTALSTHIQLHHRDVFTTAGEYEVEAGRL